MVVKKHNYYYLFFLFLFIFSLIIIFSKDKKQFIRVGLIADSQYCDCPPTVANKRYYKNSLKKMEECVDTMNREKVDFVIALGDIIHQDYESYDSILPIYNQIKMPIYYTLGNHEFEVEDSLKSKVLERLNLSDSSLYYHFTIKNWDFIFLDGTELAKYTLAIHGDLKKEYLNVRNQIAGEPHDEIWNGGISSTQLAWLEERLIDAELNNRNVLVFNHFNIFPYGTRLNLYNSVELKNLLDKYKSVKGYINGHHHSGNFIEDNGKFYFNLVGMILTEDKNSFAIMDIYDHEIRIKGFGLIKDHVIPIE